MNENTLDNTGHRQRLKERFLARESGATSQEALLELLLSYAIPLKDVQPLAKVLLGKFGDLSNVLSATPQELYRVDGVKEHTATLVKLFDWIRIHYPRQLEKISTDKQPPIQQPTLFETPSVHDEETMPSPSQKTITQRKVRPKRQGTGFFGKAILKEAIQILPQLTPNGTIDEIKNLIKQKIHFNAEATRRRNTDYIVYRMFPNNNVDPSLILFAQRYTGMQELREACFYRFCVVEPIMFRIVEELLLPSIGKGSLPRENIAEYIKSLLPSSKSVLDYSHAVIDALTAGGIVKADRKQITFGYRDIPIASFAFVIHSEFPNPGMYDIAKLENNQRMRTMLWNPDRILPTLYELRNKGFIAKISEIDNVRQFTTKWTLPELVSILYDNEKV